MNAVAASVAVLYYPAKEGAAEVAARLAAAIPPITAGVARVLSLHGNRSGRARVYAASGSGAMSIVGGAWGSNDGGAAPVTTAAQASVR